MSDYNIGDIEAGNRTHVGDNNNFYGQVPGGETPKIVTVIAAPEPSSYFTGRETELARIKKLIEKHRVVILHGIGGIGKSEICKNLFAEYKETGRHVGWVVFNENIKKTLAQKFSTLTEETDFERNFSQTLIFINKLADKLILFIDNMDVFTKDDATVLDGLACKIIITSRSKDFGNKKIYTVGELSEQDCEKLYADITERNCVGETVKRIVKKADRLTLVVELLARTAKAAHLTDAKLLEKLNEKGFDLSEIKNKVKDDKRFNEMLSSLFDLSKLTPNELLVLKQFSLFPPQFLEYKYAEKWFIQEDTPDILNDLADKGWLKMTDSAVGIHPVIVGAVKNENPPAYGECEDLVDMLGDDLKFKAEEIFTSRLGILPFGESVAEYFTEKGIEDRKISFLIHNAALLYHEQGDYEKALEYYKKSLAIDKKIHEPNHPGIATTYNNIGLVYDDQGDYEKALEYHEKAREIREKVLPPNHPNIAITYNNIGVIYYKQGDYKQALEFYEKSLAIKEKIYEPNHPNIATTYDNIGGVYYNQGEYEKALEYREKALTIYEKVLPPNHPDIATTYNNIGGAYSKQGDYEKALEYYVKAYRIDITVLGENHPNTKLHFKNTAFCYEESGKTEDFTEWLYKQLNKKEALV